MKNQEALLNNLRQIWQQLFTLLGATHTPQGRASCATLESLPAGDRVRFITQQWGQPAAVKAASHLNRLYQVEQQLSTVNDKPT